MRGPVNVKFPFIVLFRESL